MSEKKPTSQQLKEQIRIWQVRAEMAQKQGNDDLVQQALERKKQYENELAKLQEFED